MCFITGCGYYLVYIERRVENGDCRRVGLAYYLYHESFKRLIDCNPILERIVKAHFNTKVRPPTVIQVYALMSKGMCFTNISLMFLAALTGNKGCCNTIWESSDIAPRSNFSSYLRSSFSIFLRFYHNFHCRSLSVHS